MAAVGELIALFARMVFRSGVILAGITAFVMLLGFAFSFVAVSLNASVIGDLLALIQMWLPFNLGPLMAWLVTASVLYVAYRLSVVAVNYMSRFIS